MTKKERKLKIEAIRESLSTLEMYDEIPRKIFNGNDITAYTCNVLSHNVGVSPRNYATLFQVMNTYVTKKLCRSCIDSITQNVRATMLCLYATMVESGDID